MSASQATTTVEKILAGLAQGDLISVGAVSVVGRGPTAALDEAMHEAARPADGELPAVDELWSLTLESEIGWYVVLSGPCDIVRDPATEPCLVVCPVSLVDNDRYRDLRHGGYSPREFPLPDAKLRAACGVKAGEAFNPVADQRYVAVVDKTALASPDVRTLRPLTGPQQGRLAAWAGRRYSRPTHPDDVEEHVLKRATTVIARLAREGGKLPAGKRTLEQKLVASTETWLIGSAEKSVSFRPVLTESSAKAAGLFNSREAEFSEAEIKAGARKLKSLLAASITGDGFQISVAPVSWDGLTAADYLTLAEWYWEDDPDPLDD